MFSLIDGIYLEDSQALLRWGCSRKEALTIGHPTDVDNPRIKWNEKILDGQPCDLVVDLGDDAVFAEARALFHLSHITTPNPDNLFLYHTLSNYFAKKIGQRPFAGFTEEYGIAPILSWEHEECVLKLSVCDGGWQSGPITHLQISKK
jgi:hypothetical protein